MKKRHFLLGLLLIFSQVVLAQSTSSSSTTTSSSSSVSRTGSNFPKTNYRKFTVGVHGGLTQLYGDLRKINNEVAFGASARYALSYSLGLRAAYTTGTFSGRGKREAFKGIAYTNDFSEISLVFTYNFGNISFLRPNRRISPYIFMGAGYMTNDGTINIDQNAKYDESLVTVPIGLGMKYRVSNTVDIGLEYGVRYTNTDSLDVYNFPIIANRSFDYFGVGNLGLYFNLGKKSQKHMEWVNPVEAIYDDLAQMKKTLNTLTKDADNDGVSDLFDKEPNTPDSVEVYGSGRAVDTDKDGIPDHEDKEPFSDPGSTTDINGAAVDSDNDGVPDSRDLSPNTDESMLVNHQGIPIMSKENLKKLQGKNMGDVFGSLGFLPAIFFDSDKSNVTYRQYADLQSLANSLNRMESVKLVITGNADYRNTEAYNTELARRRAQAVADILVERFGVDASRLIIRTNGESVPLVNLKTAEALAANRRVEFFIASEE